MYFCRPQSKYLTQVYGDIMERLNTRATASLFFLIFAFSAFGLVGYNQNTSHTGLKKGDRVMASPSSLKDERYWRPCTVTEVHNYVPKRAYSITCDPQTKGGLPSSFVVNEDWVKPLTTENENANGGETAGRANNRAGNQTGAPAQTDNGEGACPASDSDSNLKAGLEKSFRGAIRKGFEKEPAPGADGRATVTIQTLSIGQSHPYRVYEDPNEARGKTIYPVRATFTTCTDYNRRIVLVKRERAFGCYKNTAGEWVCDIFAAANTNVKDETKSIDKPRH
jgi:hypothetical protein